MLRELVLTMTAIAVIMLSGCASRGSSPTPTLFLPPTLPPASVTATHGTPTGPLSEIALTPTAQNVQAEGPCDHLLWPLHDGASWTYQAVRIDTGSTVELHNEIEVDGAHLTLGDDVATLNCVDGALTGLPPGWLGSGHPSLGTAVQGINARGALLTEEGAILTLGIPWDLEVDAAGSVALPIPEWTLVPIVGGKIVVFSTPAPLETMDTLAGSFMALPVHQDVLYQITVEVPDGSRKDVLINAAMQQYYVEQVGLVRVMFEGGTISSTDGTITAGLEPGATLELESFRLP